MELKPSKKFPKFIIAIIAIMALLLLSLKTNKKESKYPETPVIEQKTPLDFLQISLNEKNYDKLKKKRNKALISGVLETSDADYVPATITFNGEGFKAEIRLKGDWTDHLIGDKWSFRIKLKDDKTIKGMRKFSVHHPKTRGYVNEWLYHKAIKKEELIGLRYGFLEGAIHIKKNNSSRYINKEVGIYAIEETFDKRTIESNKRKESVILKYSENLWWNGVKKSIAVGSPSGLHWNNFNISVKYPITVFSESKVLEDSTMLSYFKVGKKLLRNTGGSIPISDAFDIKKLAMQNAILNLFGGIHGNYIINLRFYYNPITSRLEPIAFDNNSGVKLKKYEHFMLAKEEKKDTIYLKELIKAMYEVSQPEYLESLIITYKQEISAYEDVLEKEFETRGFSLQNLKHNQNIIQQELIRLKQENDFIDFENELKIIKEIKTPNFSKWTHNEISLSSSNLLYNNKTSYHIARKKNRKPSYTVIPNINVDYGSNYKISIIVKKGQIGNKFGLRIVGEYPNRVDAVFNLKEGIVDDVETTGNFESGIVGIDSLGSGWYRCSLSTLQIKTKKIRIVLGPTNNKRKVNTWEASTGDKCDSYIMPSTLKIEKYVE